VCQKENRSFLPILKLFMKDPNHRVDKVLPPSWCVGVVTVHYTGNKWKGFLSNISWILIIFLRLFLRKLVHLFPNIRFDNFLSKLYTLITGDYLPISFSFTYFPLSVNDVYN
jgi:hypothetical protein